MSADARAMDRAVADAQSRIMLTAALMYLQETSRVGWGDATGECFGWTDVRDGGLGPRGPRPAGASGDPTSIPAPVWWASHANWPPYTPFPNESDSSQFPSVTNRPGGWPLPGTAVRCPMAVPARPPYAVQMTYAYNPVPYPTPYLSPTWNNNFTPQPSQTQWPVSWLANIFNTSTGSKGLLDPQPVASIFPAFAAGSIQPGGNTQDWGVESVDPTGVQIPNALTSLQVRDGTENRAWFRIYRELQGDHDDIDKASNHLWWNRVAIFDPTDPNPAAKNWSVFIVTCGAGGTRGYRFWDGNEISTWESANGFPAGTGRSLEPVTASESGLFYSQDQFESLLLSTQIMWYRCEWSALQSGGRDGNVYNDPIWSRGMQTTNDIFPGGWSNAPNGMYDLQYADTWVLSGQGWSSDVRSISTKTVGGNFKWMQRLDHDPLKW